MVLYSTTGSITTATSKVALGLSGEAAIGVIVFSGTYTGVTVTFEGTNDGTNWFLLPVVATDTLQSIASSSLTLATNATKAVYFLAGTVQQVRVRATAWSTGTANVAINEMKGELPAIPAIYQQNTLNNIAKSTVAQVAGVGSNNFSLVGSGPGVLQRYVVTTTGGAATSISFYDTAGTSTAGLQPIYVSAQAEALGTVKEVNIPFTTGLMIATVNTSAAVTVAYTLF